MDNKVTTSKKIILASYIICVILTILTIVFDFLGRDASTMGMLAGLAWTEVGVSNAFYFNKAKKENSLKLMSNYIEKMPDKFTETDMASFINSLNT